MMLLKNTHAQGFRNISRCNCCRQPPTECWFLRLTELPKEGLETVGRPEGPEEGTEGQRIEAGVWGRGATAYPCDGVKAHPDVKHGNRGKVWGRGATAYPCDGVKAHPDMKRGGSGETEGDDRGLGRGIHCEGDVSLMDGLRERRLLNEEDVWDSGTRGPECSCLSLLKLLDKGTEVFDLSFIGNHLLSEVAKRG